MQTALRTSARGLAVVLLATAAMAQAQDRFGDAPRAAEPAPAAARPAPGSAPAMADPGAGALSGTPAGVQSGDALARLEAHERQDHGVAPPAGLHTGPMHGATPASLPGGRLVTTRELVALLRGGAKGRPLVFDVLGGAEKLPGALMAVPAHQAGGFDDAVQQEFGRFLQQVTQGRAERPLVFYCASTQCWMSYNAALRAVRLGYRQVLWYRGGIEAWKHAGQPLQAAGMAAAPR
ncbi:MAG: hypothetical protein KF683_09325 [Rubrivivax sp.]|nr:hypothetical protein [Rubrivivax sp.]